MGRYLSTLLLALAGLMIVAAIALYALRNPLLEALISNQLHKQGIPLQSLEVLEVTPHRFRLQDLAAGARQELRVENILATWNLLDLLMGKPLSIEISGLQIKLDLSDEHPLGNSLQTQAPSAREGNGVILPWLPILSLRDSAIHLHSSAGDLTVTLSGDIAQRPADTQAIRFSALGSGSLGQIQILLTATLGAQGNLQGKIIIPEGRLHWPEANIARFAGETTFVFTAMRPQKIHAEFELFDVNLSDKEPLKPASEQTAQDLKAQSLPNLIADRITFTGNIDRATDAWNGTLDLGVTGIQVAAGPLHIQQGSLSLPMQMNSDQHSGRLGLRNPAQVKVGKINPIDTLNFKHSLGISIPQADFAWTKHSQGLALKHDITVIPTTFTLLATQEKSSPLEVQIQPGKMTLHGKLDANKQYQGQFAIQDAAVLLHQSHVQLQDISAHLHLGATAAESTAEFAIGQLQHLVPEPLFKTFSFSGDLKPQSMEGKPTAYILNGVGGMPGLSYIKLTGRHTPDSGNGMLKLAMTPLNFAPHKLQPEALSSALASLEEVTGVVSASAQIKWSKQGIRSSGAVVEVKNLSLTHETGKISDLNVALNLNNLLPLSSLPQQTIKIRSIDAGIPLENLLVSYQIASADLPRIILEKAQFSVMDGLVSLTPAVIDPSAARSNLLVHVDNIDLAAFFELIQVEGLTGTGHLDGHIPIKLEGEQITISDSLLTARAPGILRFKSDKASQLLAGAGEEMNLLLQAIQDFHYTELSLSLDKSAKQDLIAKLSLLGKNPNVKAGQVFRLNIKLESNIDKLLTPIRQGYHLSNDLLRSSFRLH